MSTAMTATEVAPRLLRRREVEDRVSLSFTTIWRLMQAGEFPKPVHPTPHRSRWLESDITDWINEKKAANDDAGPKGPARAKKRSKKLEARQ